VRAFHWLKYLGREHDIHLISFIESEKENGYLGEISAYCRSIETVMRRVERGFFSRLQNLFEKEPYFLVAQFRSREMQETIKRALANNSFDLIHVSTLVMAQYVKKVTDIPVVIDGIDSAARNTRMQWHYSTSPRNRLLAFIDWLKIRRFEPQLYTQCVQGILNSPVDKEFARRANPSLPLIDIPNGVDLEYYRTSGMQDDFPSLVFVGLLSYEPNADAVLYFCSSILPLIEKKYPGICVSIVGDCCPNSLKDSLRAKRNVTLTGFVDDVRPYLEKATVAVCPLRIGTGVKNKVLEALSMSKALVTTPIGIEGIPAAPGKELLAASTPQEFAGAVIRLLENKEYRDTMGRQARKFVEQNFIWETLAARMNTVYRSALQCAKK